MQELNLRLGQAVALTYAQTDDNFKRLKTAIDALEVAVAVAGNGTVTSVGLALPNIFTVTNSPVTSAGTLTATLASQAANRFFASPNGTSGTPTFRSFLAADLGSITVPITNGGTGLAAPILNNYVLSSNGSAYQARELQGSLGLTITPSAAAFAFTINPGDINITGFAGTLTSTKGGTGFSGPFAINQILLGNGSSSWTSPVLTAGSGISITNGVGTVTIANTAAVVSALNTLTGSVNIGFGSSGTDLNVTTPTTSDITLNIPSASASNRGVLTSADWTTFNNKLSGSGTTGKIPIFTGANSIGNSLLTYTSAFSQGNLIFASGDSGSKIETVGSVSGEVRASGNSGTRVTYIFADSTSSTLGWTNATILNFQQGSTVRGGFDASGNFAMNGGFNVLTSGNVQTSKGFALNGFDYWNTASNYVFSSNEQYGVILGPTSPNTMSVALPTTPMGGQEVCILTEETKVLTLTSTYTIYGHNAGVNIDVTITGGAAAGAAGVLVKFAGAANGGLGAWFITGL
jgi:hypothetical protein